MPFWPPHISFPLAALSLITLLQLTEAPSILLNIFILFLWAMIALQRLGRSFSSRKEGELQIHQESTSSVYDTARSEFDSEAPPSRSASQLPEGIQIVSGDIYAQTMSRMIEELSPDFILKHCGWRVIARDYMRFAKARDGKLDDSLKLMREHVEFRRAHGPLENMNPNIDFPHAMASKAWKFAGVTRCGHPFAVFRAKNIVPKDIQGGVEEYVKYLAYNLDSLGKTADSIPDSDGKLVVLIDLQGWSMSRNVDMNFARQFVRLAQDEFPERLYAAMLINCPFVFTAFWRVIRPCLDVKTREKIDIFGSNYHDTLVNKFLNKEQLEEEYGGTHRPYPDKVEHTMTFL